MTYGLWFMVYGLWSMVYYPRQGIGKALSCRPARLFDHFFLTIDWTTSEWSNKTTCEWSNQITFERSN